MKSSAGPLEVVCVELEGEGRLGVVADWDVQVVQLVNVPEKRINKFNRD
jgi:hypothetical protein